MDRRSFLAGTTTAVGTLLAGCSGSTDEYVPYVSLFNYTDGMRSISVRITDTDGETLLDDVFGLASDSAREDITISGDPARIRVQVGERDPKAFEWPSTDSCREENTAGHPGLEVLIHDQVDSPRDDITYQWECQSIRPDETTREEPAVEQFSVRSPAFEYPYDEVDSAIMGRLFTREGANVPPPLVFDAVPTDTETLVVVASDVGMPENPIHWLLWNLPVRSRLPGDIDHGPEPAAVDALQGTNTYGNVGYDGPTGPGDIHRMEFEVYALPGRLDVPGGAEYPAVKRGIEQFDRTVAGFSSVYER